VVSETFPASLHAKEREKLCSFAACAAERAYARYSHFRVGAAVLGLRGTYLGANIENASYGLSLCAERVALAAALTQGETSIRALAIAFLDVPSDFAVNEALPCGACRQWIAELAPGAEIIICPGQRVLRLSDLLPDAFRLREPEQPIEAEVTHVQG